MARKWTIPWEPPSVTQDASAPTQHVSQNNRAANAFDPSTDESVILTGAVPDNYSGGTLKLRIYGFANATSGAARFEVSTEFRTPNSNESGNTDDFDGTPDSGSITSDSAWEVAYLTITLSPATTPVAGDLFRIKVTRDGGGSGGTDDMSADFLALYYEFFEEA